MAFRISQMLDVSEGVQPDQFAVGSRVEIDSLDDLDPIYKQLLDEPVTAVLSVIGGDGRPTSRRSGSATKATTRSSTSRSTGRRPSGCVASRASRSC
jgi:hypothetical protein